MQPKRICQSLHSSYLSHTPELGRHSGDRRFCVSHGNLTPPRISRSRSHCVPHLNMGAVTGREYHCRLWRSSHLAGTTCHLQSDIYRRCVSIDGAFAHHGPKGTYLKAVYSIFFFKEVLQNTPRFDSCQQLFSTKY